MKMDVTLECPRCLTQLNGHIPLAAKKGADMVPKPGHRATCHHCGSWMVITEGPSARLPNEEEHNDMVKFVEDTCRKYGEQYRYSFDPKGINTGKGNGRRATKPFRS
jgi:hypothetical protein